MQQRFDQSLMEGLQEIPTEMAENKTIQQHRAAQTALIELLEETTDVTSQSLGEEFAQSAGVGAVEHRRPRGHGSRQ